ncbi:hypothetical protein F0562_011940 [Nyssa sinensis]|uniref:Major facilitator superfamily (MFS) profile domain-containing protein n=1 Tax=Nyssa sinensis TaxID=561372 RepID=A0A5J4ZQW7_9ASTE|nr:hypothetical protein F0562_011940 [Nyssa sinensis]
MDNRFSNLKGQNSGEGGSMMPNGDGSEGDDDDEEEEDGVDEGDGEVEGLIDIQGTPGRMSASAEDEEEAAVDTPDVHGVGMKIQRAEEAYKAYAGFEDKPTKGEVFGWCLYDLCSYFIHTVLIPIVFPLIISQIMSMPQEPAQGWKTSYKGLPCRQKEMQLYEGLTHRSIKVGNMNFSPLEWTSISWVSGIILAAPILATISIHLDNGQHQLIAAAAIAAGALFCLPAGFFRTTRIFPPYIAAIVVANAIGTASHARHFGLMVRGFIGSTIRKNQFPDRRAVGGWLSLYATAAGCLGSAIISAFTYHMLRQSEEFISLWVVSIFSGLKWLVGIVHVFASNRLADNPSSSSNSIPKSDVISIFKYPHAAGSLAGVFLSSFATMCIFTGGVLYLVGQLCIKPVNLLYLWLTYFIFPLFSLPLIQPLQQLIRADAVKMQLLGFLLSTLTSGVGFYYHDKNWHKHHLLFFTAVQGTATGLLHAFGRVLFLDCSPAGKEGTFSVWFSWVRALGTLVGFAFASSGRGNISRSLGVAFCSAIVGIVILIFGNISNFGGAKAAGHVRDDSEKGSPVHGLEDNRPMHMETPREKTEV